MQLPGLAAGALLHVHDLADVDLAVVDGQDAAGVQVRHRVAEGAEGVLLGVDIGQGPDAGGGVAHPDAQAALAGLIRRGLDGRGALLAVAHILHGERAVPAAAHGVRQVLHGVDGRAVDALDQVPGAEPRVARGVDRRAVRKVDLRAVDDEHAVRKQRQADALAAGDKDARVLHANLDGLERNPPQKRELDPRAARLLRGQRRHARAERLIR